MRAVVCQMSADDFKSGFTNKHYLRGGLFFTTKVMEMFNGVASVIAWSLKAFFNLEIATK